MEHKVQYLLKYLFPSILNVMLSGYFTLSFNKQLRIVNDLIQNAGSSRQWKSSSQPLAQSPVLTLSFASLLSESMFSLTCSWVSYCRIILIKNILLNLLSPYQKKKPIWARTAGSIADWINVREELTVHFTFQKFENTVTGNRNTRERLPLETKWVRSSVTRWKESVIQGWEHVSH